MSRIHEALKKAEQERAMSQPGHAEPVPAAAPLETPTVAANVAAAVASAVITSPETGLARVRQTRWDPDSKTMLFFGSEEHTPGMEEFRTLRSRLYQAREKHPLSRVLVTSALPREGKSFTSANLAQVIVRQHGRRVLLIDADLRNPQLHNLLGADSGPGLSEYLRGESDEYSILQRGPLDNLFFIPAGQLSSNSAELLSNGRMKTLLNRLDPLFDWTIIDSPPAVPVSDAAILANDCDGVLLVVRSNSTPIDAAKRARNEFAGNKLVGVLLNGITPELSPYVQYYYAPEHKREVRN